jgi:hypothetical protein
MNGYEKEDQAAYITAFLSGLLLANLALDCR